MLIYLFCSLNVAATTSLYPFAPRICDRLRSAAVSYSIRNVSGMHTCRKTVARNWIMVSQTIGHCTLQDDKVSDAPTDTEMTQAKRAYFAFGLTPRLYKVIK